MSVLRRKVRACCIAMIFFPLDSSVLFSPFSFPFYCARFRPIALDFFLVGSRRTQMKMEIYFRPRLDDIAAWDTQQLPSGLRCFSQD
ncbi:hypothetical protein M433DRAFT_375172 [Acidomyces richmondensis BFW]|nr:MAG: hypothetical protein FE78DRAFT_515064 [Acidomyces sp. 'richmondensis']KYG43044.1 hypothetical protein M433DRAFT_375172 [Acidomyces richmondensis BFW]